jgi:DNA-directed RNA polymerase subunit RPC12/RpoP
LVNQAEASWSVTIISYFLVHNFILKEEKMNDVKDVTTYEMKFKCWNCFNEFNKKIIRGRSAIDSSGECPYCGLTSLNNGKDVHQVVSFVKLDDMIF